MQYEPENYDALLADKVQHVRTQFAAHLNNNDNCEDGEDGAAVRVYPSEPSHFRSRARFAVGRLAPDGPLRYLLFEGAAIPPVLCLQRTSWSTSVHICHSTHSCVCECVSV